MGGIDIELLRAVIYTIDVGALWVIIRNGITASRNIMFIEIRKSEPELIKKHITRHASYFGFRRLLLTSLVTVVIAVVIASTLIQPGRLSHEQRVFLANATMLSTVLMYNAAGCYFWGTLMRVGTVRYLILVALAVWSIFLPWWINSTLFFSVNLLVVGIIIMSFARCTVYYERRVTRLGILIILFAGFALEPVTSFTFNPLYITNTLGEEWRIALSLAAFGILYGLFVPRHHAGRRREKVYRAIHVCIATLCMILLEYEKTDTAPSLDVEGHIADWAGLWVLFVVSYEVLWSQLLFPRTTSQMEEALAGNAMFAGKVLNTTALRETLEPHFIAGCTLVWADFMEHVYHNNKILASVFQCRQFEAVWKLEDNAALRRQLRKKMIAFDRTYKKQAGEGDTEFLSTYEAKLITWLSSVHIGWLAMCGTKMFEMITTHSDLIERIYTAGRSKKTDYTAMPSAGDASIKRLLGAPHDQQNTARFMTKTGFLPAEVQIPRLKALERARAVRAEIELGGVDDQHEMEVPLEDCTRILLEDTGWKDLPLE